MRRITLFLICGWLWSVGVQAAQTQKFQKMWDAYVTSTETVPLQPACKASWIHADPTVKFHGTILLHHGFSACTQQFYEWGENFLSKNGYDVLLAVMPGHGRADQDLSSLPTRSNWKEIYQDEIGTLNALMSESSGTKVLGGFSLGGGVAAASMLAAPSLYDRVILFSPFFRVSSLEREFPANEDRWLSILQAIAGPLNQKKPDLIDYFSDPKNAFEKVSHLRFGFGADCDDSEKAGRQGYCQFNLSTLSGDQQLGLETIAQAAQAKSLPLIQIVAAEQDPTASTHHMRLFIDSVKQGTGVSPQVCFFGKKANHSLLSRFDTPNENKYWLPFLLKQATDFVVDAKPVDHFGSVPDEGSLPYCSIESVIPAQL